MNDYSLLTEEEKAAVDLIRAKKDVWPDAPTKTGQLRYNIYRLQSGLANLMKNCYGIVTDEDLSRLNLDISNVFELIVPKGTLFEYFATEDEWHDTIGYGWCLHYDSNFFNIKDCE